MRVPLFPKHALGVVTLDGNIVTEGSVIAASGSLVVNCGAYASSDIRVWNGTTEWTPQSVVGNTQYYNVSSDGEFYVKHSDGRTLLSFSVVIPQSFTIDVLLAWLTTDPLVPHDVIAEGTYRQRDTWKRGTEYGIWVKSTGKSIVNLPLSATNGAVVTSLPKASGYGDEYLSIKVDTSASSVGQPVSVYVGNVLVVYFATLTA